MKKIISLLLVLVMAISLAGCGKSEAAQNVDTLIEAIGAVTLESEAAIQKAEAAYNALTQEDKDQLEHYETLTAARAALDEQKEALRVEQVKQVAAAVDNTISAIGTVTLESGDAIAAARTSYDALDAETKSYVTQLTALEEAEATLVQLQALALAQAQAQEVSALIAAIGDITTESGDAIRAAEEAYNALSADAMALVENVSVLEGAITAYDDMMQDMVDDILSDLQADIDEVRGMSFYYCSSFPYYTSYGYWGADIRSFVLPYMGMQGDNVWLRLVCNYTSSDWLFFEQMTFAVDEERYYKFFSYYDVVRDNEWGDIWEYVDIEVGESEIELLKAIANSEKTIVRFEGDTYYDDFVVSEEDKESIKEMLLVYEYLANK